ncbi:FxSxx-COOH system tetratricopeptide repeat protein [Actinoplanes italicus]|uniref:FxSxx-COOH system tetratricopeptide repeat protein n=1 Tax=Actinoplanes italicus TaxID=113567 RepID=UPI001943BB85|nr:FxSxx-COOH system tetratricopeptide repeat protein [Actinoplanes italicus]
MVSRILISHAGRDRPWAEWARWHLEAAGHQIELDSADRAPGTNFVEAMDRALHRDNPMLVLLSSAYLDPKRFTADEWTARFAQRRKDPDAKLIPIRIENIDLNGGLWAPIVVPDLFDLPADEAVTVLVEAVRRVVTQSPAGAPRAAPPVFPGRRTSVAAATEAGPRPPGSLPAVWNLARRNLGFTGRDGMLNNLHDTLRGGSRVAVQALHGMGGVGKTQLALEYAHRFAGEYDLVWWIPSEQPELISDHLSALALKLRLVSAGTAIPEAVEALREHLRRTGRWLLVFDNAEERDELAPWLPDGPGHLLITSRNHNWTGVARPVDVDVFMRGESVDLLRANLAGLTEIDADRLADALGDLPLAVGQAVDLLTETRMSIDVYLSDLTAHTADLMKEGRPPGGYPLSLAASVALSADRLRAADPAAGELLHLCARLGSQPIPADLFTARPDLLPAPLDDTARKPLALARTTARLGLYGLARLTDAGPVLHRLIQAVLRDIDIDPVTHHTVVERLLAAAGPDDGSDPRWWPRWSVLLPHLLAVGPVTTTDPGLRSTTAMAMWHLMSRGESRAALPLVEHLYEAWTRLHGPDDISTTYIANVLSAIHRQLGNYRRTHDLCQEIFTRTRRLHGDDHPNTLSAAHNLADILRGLGDYQQAREMDEDNLARRRRVLGEDDPATLRTATNLVMVTALMGDFAGVRELAEDTFARKRRVLGDDHPETLRTATNLAGVLRQLGEIQRALELNTATLARSRKVLGDEHPDTLESASALAAAYLVAGETRRALELEGETLAVQARVLGEEHPDTLRSAASLTELQRLLSDEDPAGAQGAE